MSEETRGKGLLKIYIGTEEDGIDHLYLDLAVPTREINLWSSLEELNDCSGADFLGCLEMAFNEARIFSKCLGLRIKIEMEEILDTVQEMEESEARNVRKLIKEME